MSKSDVSFTEALLRLGKFVKAIERQSLPIARGGGIREFRELVEQDLEAVLRLPHPFHKLRILTRRIRRLDNGRSLKGIFAISKPYCRQRAEIFGKCS